MTKILKVIKPFFVMENGDTFEYNADTDQYESVYNEEHNSSNEDNSTVVSSYNSVYRISKEYVKMLLDNGYVEEVDEKKRFVNIFDEIDNKLSEYNNELYTLKTKADENTPQCLLVEKETVLRNMIKLLEYLKGLKK
jgi:acetyl-CoA carboxylase beta subunit